MSKGKNFGIPTDSMPLWNTLVHAEYSFVTAGDNSVDLYLLAMAVGLRLDEKPKLIALTDNFQYGQILKRCDIDMLGRYFGIDPSSLVPTLGRYAGIGLNYIYRYHYDDDSAMLDISSIYNSFSGPDIHECQKCGKYNPVDVSQCSCEK